MAPAPIMPIFSTWPTFSSRLYLYKRSIKQIAAARALSRLVGMRISSSAAVLFLRQEFLPAQRVAHSARIGAAQPAAGLAIIRNDLGAAEGPAVDDGNFMPSLA